MLLSRREILDYIKSGKIHFEPAIPEDSVRQVSIDLRLGRKFTQFKPCPGHVTSIQMHESLWASVDLWQHDELGSYCLKPNEFVLAQTLEVVSIPGDLAGLVEGRSSWARMGIAVHLTAPKIDPGFKGPITLELANFAKTPIQLRAEIDKPAQLMLIRLSSALSEKELYGSSEKDVFQYQKDPIPYRE